MYDDYMPGIEADFINWGSNLTQNIEADAARFGVTAAQTLELSALYATYRSLYDAILNPDTRTPPKYRQKADARRAFETLARQIVAVVQGQPTTSDADRSLLQITIRKPYPEPVPVPRAAPNVEVESVRGRLINLRLRDSQTSKRRRPKGVRSAMMFWSAGEAAPASPSQITLAGTSPSMKPQVVVDDAVEAGSRVWVSVCWMNGSGELGPPCQPVEAWTNGLAMKAAG